MYGPLYLASFTLYNVFKVHPLCSIWLNLFMAEKYSITMYQLLCTCSSAGGHLGCFCCWAIVNSAAMDIHVPFLWEHILTSLGYVPGSGVAGAYDVCSAFNFFRPFPFQKHFKLKGKSI